MAEIKHLAGSFNRTKAPPNNIIIKNVKLRPKIRASGNLLE